MLDRRVRYLVISIMFHGGLVGGAGVGVSSKGCRQESESQYLVSRVRLA
jgi:hypothetical protein